jgi:membrane protein
MSWRERLAAARSWLTAQPLVVRVGAVMQLTDTAGGPLLAAALAFGTLFAIVPVLLLLSGVLGWLIDDPLQKQELLRQLVAAMPPLADLFDRSLSGAIAARGALSLVGIVGLLWASSNFYASLDEVMRRIFGGPARGIVARRVRGVVAIVVLIGLVVATIALSGVFALVERTVGQFVAWRWLALFVALGLTVLVVLAAYRLVPTEPPSLREALPPAIAAGLGIGLLTNLFSALAPLLIGGLAGFGVLATIFGALVWLNLCYQVLLYGAAWARYRRDQAGLAGGPLPGQN